MREVVEHQHVTVGADTIITKSQRHVSVFAIINLNFIALEQQTIFFTREIFAPETFFSAYNEMSVIIVAFCPREGRGSVELDSFSAKRDFTRFKNDPKNHVAERCSQRSANTSCHARICLHQSWYNDTASHTHDCSADCYAVWNNEMLKIDESSDDQERNENPVCNRHLPRELLPDRKEKKCGDEFHCEIAKRNFRPAICASAAKREPTH